MEARLSRNVAANLVGRAWVALMGIAFVPAYVGILGAEAYGVIGLYASLMALAAILDMGATATLNRELARMGTGRGGAARDLVRTLGLVQWGLAAALGLAVALSAPWLAGHWLRVDRLPVEAVERAVRLMGAALALQLPINLYVSGLLGLQVHVAANLLNGGFAAVRAGGSVAALWVAGPTLDTFFTWQLAASVAHVAGARAVLARWVPVGGAFRPSLIHGLWRFAAGVSGVTTLLILMSQLDKVVLSRMLPLEEFGRYALAALVAQSLQILVHPFFAAAYPRFSELAGASDEEGIRRLYHAASAGLAVVLLPAAAVLAANSGIVLHLWTGNAELASQTAPILSVLVLGTALHGLASMPFALQLAHGWTGFALRATALGAILMVPLLLLMVRVLGTVGGGLAWATLNLAYLGIALPAMHRRLLRGDLSRWYREDVGRPLAATLVAVGGLSLLLPAPASAVQAFIHVGATACAALASSVASAPGPRRWALAKLPRLRPPRQGRA